MALEVGRTHDVVVLLNDTQELGLTVKPHTYRLGRAPEFIPRMGGADPSAGDFDWWRAFIQRDFSLGEGEQESARLEGLQTFAGGYGVSAWPAGLGPALLPHATSMEGTQAITLSCDQDIHIVEMSDAPRLVYKQLLLTHTDDLWVHTHTQLGQDAKSVVMHSNVMFVGFGAAQTYRAYGAVYQSGVPGPTSTSCIPAVYYTPAYTTEADLMWNYDGKLWRAREHNIAYLTPTSGWSAFTPVGTADDVILNVEMAFGRVYFGKRDGLWCYEGGRIYETEPFHAESDPNNFKLMHASHGALYFNIRNKLYRYTGGGNIELLMVYPYEAFLGPASTAQNKVYFSVRDQSHCGSLYSYDFRGQGFFREVDLQAEAARHTVHDVVHVTGLGVSQGKMFIAPYESTSLAGATRALGVQSGGPVFPDQALLPYPASTCYWGELGENNLATRWAVRLTCTANGVLTGVRFCVMRTGSPADLIFGVYADDGGTPGKPTGALLASGVVSASSVAAWGPSAWNANLDLGWVTGVFSTPLSVSTGTKYHLCVSVAGDIIDEANHYNVKIMYKAGWGTDLIHRYNATPVWYNMTDYKMVYQHLYAPPTPPFGSRISYLPTRLVGAPPLEYPRQFGGYIKMYTPWLTLGYPSLTKFVSSIAVEALLEGPGSSMDVSIAIDGGEAVGLEGFVEEYTTGVYEDLTANVSDWSDSTYESFEWGTWASEEALFKNAGQDVYICGTRPFDSVVWRLQPGVYHSRRFTAPDSDVLLEVWTGAGWRPAYISEDTTKEANWRFAKSGQISWRPPRHWESRTFQNITGYWLRMRVVNTPTESRQNDQRIYGITLLANSSETQHYTPAGQITARGNSLTEFKVAQLAQRIALRFDFIGDREASAFLKSFKISYNPVGAGKREVRFIAIADDNIKRLDGVEEHSGQYIAEAVQSCHAAGILYVVGLPYPTPHSINAQVQLGESIMVPLLAYTAQTGKPTLIPYADVSLRIIEG